MMSSSTKDYKHGMAMMLGFHDALRCEIGANRRLDRWGAPRTHRADRPKGAA
jgi:hypothetical protein